MIARRRLYALPVTDSISVDTLTADITVDTEMLNAILRSLQRSASYAVDTGKYDDALEMLQCYKAMKEVLMALKEKEMADLIHADKENL